MNYDLANLASCPKGHGAKKLGDLNARTGTASRSSLNTKWETEAVSMDGNILIMIILADGDDGREAFFWFGKGNPKTLFLPWSLVFGVSMDDSQWLIACSFEGRKSF